MSALELFNKCLDGFGRGRGRAPWVDAAHCAFENFARLIPRIGKREGRVLAKGHPDLLSAEAGHNEVALHTSTRDADAKAR